MKQHLLTFAFFALFLCLSSTKINAQTLEFTQSVVKKIPKSVDDFLSMRDELGQTPNGGASCFLLALLVYANNNELGIKLLTMTMDRDILIQGNGYNGFQPKIADLATIKALLAQKPYFFNTFVAGTLAGQNYQLPIENLAFDFLRNPPAMYKESGEIYRILIQCNADNKPKMLKMRKDYKGFWKVYDWSGILSEFPKEK
jgi:hypothetical protein